MKIKLHIIFLAAFAINVAYGQSKYSVERIEKLDINFDNEGGPDESDVLARVVMRTIKPGVSYMVYRVLNESTSSELSNIQLKTTRILVK